jgi:hypothetical protein
LDIKITKPAGVVLSLELSGPEASELLAALDYAAGMTLAYTVADRLVQALDEEGVEPAEGIYE